MINVTYFPKISIPTDAKVCGIDKLLKAIQIGGKDGTLRRNVEEIRKYLHDDKTRRELKRRYLPVITWQGIFSKRENSGLQSLTGIMCIDLDHISQEKIMEIKQRLSFWPYILAAFLSPSGDGMKVLVLTDNKDARVYENCYKQLEQHFFVNFGIKTDKSCEPISQGCFASYDPDLYINLNATPMHLGYNPAFEEDENEDPKAYKTSKILDQQYATQGKRLIETMESKLIKQLTIAQNDMTDDKIIEILDRKFMRFPQNYQDGHRTRAVFVQASTLCKAGIPERTAIDYLRFRFLPTGFDDNKLSYEVGRAYSKNTFGLERDQYLSYENYMKKKND